MQSSEEYKIEGNAGEYIQLPIASGSATGYQWTLQLPEGVIQVEDGPARVIDASTRLGAGAGGYLQVKAEPGEHLITAKLARPWEPDRPTRTVTIRLHVK